MKKFYTSVHINFLKKVIAGRSHSEAARLFNERFGLSKTDCAVRTILTKHGIGNNRGRGIPRERKYLAHHIQFLKRNIAGRSYAELAKLFSKQFGISVPEKKMNGILKRHKITNGIDCRFKPGHVSHNKGKKGCYFPGSEKGWFKPGHPGYKHNEKAIGSERITVDGYIEIKYSDNPGTAKHRWKGYHIMVWEKANGPIPKGHAIIFADRNNRNFKLSNLLLVSRAELCIMNRNGLISGHKDLTAVGKTVATIKLEIANRKRKTINSRRKKLVIIDKNGREIVIVRNANGHYMPARKYEWGLQALWAQECPPRKTKERAEDDLKAYAFKRGWQRI